MILKKKRWKEKYGKVSAAITINSNRMQIHAKKEHQSKWILKFQHFYLKNLIFSISRLFLYLYLFWKKKTF